MSKLKKTVCVLTAALTAASLTGCASANTSVSTSSAKDEISKEETVYVIADANGNSQEVIVSDRLKGIADKDSFEDYSELSDIENVKGEETFTNENGKLVWNVDGSDIYYQGKSDKALPVDISVKYALDGKEVTPEEIEGKSGHVAITISYKNNEKQTADVDGVSKELYSPYAALSTVILDNDKFKNVTVSKGGTIVDDGEKQIVAATAFPGMNENLDITDEDKKLPEEITIEADAENFSLITVLSTVTNSIFSSDEELSLDSITDMKGDLDELLTASQTIEDSATTLAEGTGQIYDGAAKLLSGSGSLSSGAGNLLDGITSITQGAGTLKTNLGDLKDGLEGAKDGIVLIADGAKTAQETLSGITPKVEKAVTGSQSLYEGLVTMQSGINGINNGLDALAENLGNGISYANDAITTLDALAAAYPDDPAIQQYVAGAKAQIGGSIKYQSGVQSQLTSDDKSAVKGGVTYIAKLLPGAVSGAEELKDGIGEMGTLMADFLPKVNDLCDGAEELRVGLADAYDGASQLYAGAAALEGYCSQAEAGASALNSGAKAINSGLGTLKSGSSDLNSGAQQLSDGIKTFNTDGIDKLYDVLVNDLLSKTDVLEAMQDIASQHTSFGGKPEDVSGSVTYIYRTQSIGD